MLTNVLLVVAALAWAIDSWLTRRWLNETRLEVQTLREFIAAIRKQEIDTLELSKDAARIRELLGERRA